ncbi:sortase domain-containing protein [Enterococcus sp. BWR-S5]|uniref:sortase domain-containing protein n=1 Tax=Enterococcus sp. BWR-S5 TaxID=2787714 RepID=UPI001F20ED14|nr:sortase [Enterococcus sp. BWR-S5]
MKKRTLALLFPMGAAVLLGGAVIFDHSVAAENTSAIRSAVSASSQLEESSTVESTETSTTTSTEKNSTPQTVETEAASSTAPVEVETEPSVSVESEVAVDTPAPEEQAVATPVQSAIVSETASQPAPVEVSAPTYQAMTLSLAGQTISYQNGGTGSGQGIIDSNPNGVAATWGGAPVQSGDDGMNTHIIGHNPGAFSALFSVGIGSQIVVTDGAGTPTTYTVQNVMQVDDYGKELSTGQDVWDLTVGTGGGERITLQTCVNDDVNLFVLAYK